MAEWIDLGAYRRLARHMAAAALLTCILPSLPLHAEDVVFPPGSHVGLVPPQGMTLSANFTGFVNATNGASILISALPPAAYDQIANSLTAEQMAAKGMTLIGDCKAVTPAFESRCYRATQQAMGQRFQKWLLIVRLDGETSMVVATIPDAAITSGAYSTANIETSLSSLAYSDSSTQDPLAALPFTIEESDLLPFQQTFGGSAALYAGPPSGSAPKPIWVVASSLGVQPQAKDLAFSRAAFRGIDSVVQPEITNEQPFAANQLEGHILEGTAKDKKSGAELYIFQALVVDSAGKYYRMVGLVPTADKSTYRPEFLRLVNTLHPK